MGRQLVVGVAQISMIKQARQQLERSFNALEVGRLQVHHGIVDLLEQVIRHRRAHLRGVLPLPCR